MLALRQASPLLPAKRVVLPHLLVRDHLGRVESAPKKYVTAWRIVKQIRRARRGRDRCTVGVVGLVRGLPSRFVVRAFGLLLLIPHVLINSLGHRRLYECIQTLAHVLAQCSSCGLHNPPQFPQRDALHP